MVPLKLSHEMVPMRDHVCFNGRTRTIIHRLSFLPLLIWSTDFCFKISLNRLLGGGGRAQPKDNFDDKNPPYNKKLSSELKLKTAYGIKKTDQKSSLIWGKIHN